MSGRQLATLLAACLLLSSCLAGEFIEFATREDPAPRPKTSPPAGWTRDIGSGSFATPGDWVPAERGQLHSRGLTSEDWNLAAASSPDGSCVVTRWGVSGMEPPPPAAIPEYVSYHADEELEQVELEPFDLAVDGFTDGRRRRLVGPTHEIVAYSAWHEADTFQTWLMFACDDDEMIQDIAATWAP